MTNPEQLPARFDELTSQFSQFRTEVRAELSAVRIEIREPGQTLHVEMQEPYAWLDAGVRLRARDTVVR